MVERVTFFGVNGPEQGASSHRLDVKGTPGPQVILAWTAGPAGPLADGLDTTSEMRTSSGGFGAWLRDSGGGVMAEIYTHSDTVRLHRSAPDGEGDIQRVIRLSPFAGAEPLLLVQDVEEFRLGRGEHLLVPVSARAEERMMELQKLLAEMGPDVEALVLHTLRSPSIETRLGRLEEALELDRSGASSASWWSRRGRRRAKKAPGAVATRLGGAARRRPWFRRLGLAVGSILILLVLIAGWYLFKGSRASSQPGDEGAETSATGAPAQPVATPGTETEGQGDAASRLEAADGSGTEATPPRGAPQPSASSKGSHAEKPSAKAHTDKPSTKGAHSGKSAAKGSHSRKSSTGRAQHGAGR